MLHKGHIAVDVVSTLFSPRVKAIIDLFTSIIFFAMVGALFWHGLKMGLASAGMQETTGTPLYWPVYPFKLLVPVAAFLLLLQGVAKFARDLMLAVAGRDV